MKPILDEINRMLDSLVENDVESYIELLTDKLSSSSADIIGLAAGRMGYSLRGFIMRLNHMGFNASMIGDTNVPRVRQNSILFINSFREINNSSVLTPNFFAYTGSIACSASTKAHIPPAFWASATTCKASVVFPEDSGP